MSNVFNAKNTKVFVVLIAMALMIMFQMDFASAADPNWTSAVETEIKTAGTDVTTLLLKILTVALGIFALQWGVRKAMKFFKATTN